MKSPNQSIPSVDHNPRLRGFTLVELLVVIAIIGLVFVGLVNFVMIDRACSKQLVRGSKYPTM